MTTTEQIEKQLKTMDGASRLLGRKEIKELPNILWDDETLEKMAQGMYNRKQGLLVATNWRLIFLDKGLVYGLRVEDFPYDKISSIQYETGMAFGRITIYTYGNKATIQQLPKQLARDFAEFVRAHINRSDPSDQSAGSPTDDIPTQLEKLAKLKEQGILTQDEFDTQKKKILEQ